MLVKVSRNAVSHVSSIKAPSLDTTRSVVPPDGCTCINVCAICHRDTGEALDCSTFEA